MADESQKKPLRIALPGASGRMGQKITEVVNLLNNYKLVAATDRPDSQYIGRNIGGVGTFGNPDADEIIVSGDARNLIEAQPNVIIDFTTPEASIIHANLAAEAAIPMVIGTTGHNDAQRRQIENAAKKTAIALCANTSIGILMISKIVAELSEKICAFDKFKNWDVEIIETHHRNKTDAPSGTALALAKAVDWGGIVKLDNPTVFDRTNKRQDGKIGFAVSRGGDVVGEHRIIFYNNTMYGEEMEFRHRVTDRRVFVHGALSIAQAIINRPPKLYSVQDLFPNWAYGKKS